MNPAPFLILETGRPVPSLRRYGRFPHWIRVAAGLEEHETVVVDVEHGDALPDPHAFAGVLVTRSAAPLTPPPPPPPAGGVPPARRRRSTGTLAAGWLPCLPLGAPGLGRAVPPRVRHP